jgi:hypothetical protein
MMAFGLAAHEPPQAGLAQHGSLHLFPLAMNTGGLT